MLFENDISTILKIYLGVCITASGNIRASRNISLNLFMVPLETIELLIFWYDVAGYHIAQL